MKYLKPLPSTRRLSTRSKLLIATLAALLSAVSSLLFWPSPWARAEDREPVAGAPAAPPKMQACCGKPEDADDPHSLAAAYYSVRDGLSATLMLNNKGPRPVEITPTLYSLSGARHDAPTVTVEAESFRMVNLRDLGALPGSAFEEGSVGLFHLGPDLVIGAQLYMVDERRSLSFDEKLAEFNKFPSTRLESVWWLPPGRSDARLALSNTGDTPITVSAVIGDGSPQPRREQFALSAHETRLVDLRQKQRGGGAEARSAIGSASLSHTGAKGALLARALISDAATGYSWSAQFIDPGGARSSGYQGVGLRVGNAGGERLKPVVVAYNNGGSPSTLTGRMPYAARDGGTGAVQLPSVTLAPGGAAEVDVSGAIRSQVRVQDIATASLEFEYTGAPGSVVMSAGSVSASGNHVFRVPMWDVPAQRNGTGGYPWYIEGDSATSIFIKNVTDEKQNYTLSLTFDGGVYAPGVKTIEPRQTVHLDLRAIRDRQVPDERGRTIPPGAARGKIEWSVRGPDSLALLGRSEQTDIKKGMSSSYACFMCCPNSFLSSWLDPGSAGLDIGSVVTFRGVEQDYNCYGSPQPPYYWGGWYPWLSDNPNIAGVDSSGNVTAYAYGTANISTMWDVYWYQLTTENIYAECREYPYTTEPQAPTNVCTRPTGETTASGGWADAEGFPTVHKWNQTLTPSTTNFSGRTVTEEAGTGNADTCHFQGSSFPPAQLSGGTWTVGTGNTWGADFVGFTPNAVTYYRQRGRAPCGANVGQRMVINCAAGTYLYQTNLLGMDIGATTVSSSRGGGSATRTWP